MVKSTVSCFKLISCGSDSVDHDDLQSPQIKSSSGRGWSFRKKSSPGHRVLSNTVISEASSSANKDSPESALNFQLQPNSTVPEKTSVVQWREEKTELPAQLVPKVSGDIVTGEDDSREDATLDESSIIVIQAAIRGLLARKVLLKQKNIIKLQSAVRGHLVRKHAVGTLRCVQAIVKMQALVRTRRARLLVEGSGGFEKQSESDGKYNHDSTLLSKRQVGTSVEKLLSNKFARQIMESSPRTKSINIKCDPSKSDSAWKWLERWMSVSTVSNEEPHESGSAVLQQEKEHLGHSESKNDIFVPSESTDLKYGVGAPGESAERSENDDSSITYVANNLDINSCKSMTPASGHPNHHNIDESKSTYGITESAPLGTKKTGSITGLEAETFPDKEEPGSDRDIPDSKMFSTEQPEIEAKKFSRSASNPSFIAAQSKFEELSSIGTSAKLTTSSSQDLRVESSLDKISSSTDKPLITKEIGLAENYISNASSVQIFGSESGTEISISSTLDPLDRSEIEVKDLKWEPKISDMTVEHPNSRENLEVEANRKGTDSSMDVASPQIEKKPEADPSDQQLELESEASPKSHITVLESQATPCSQVSVKSKKSRGEKSDPNRKNRSSSANKKSHSNPNEDSASRSSLEKEHKTGKRRNSVSSSKSDHAEQESKDNSSTSSLPSYMQATKSAKAKAIDKGSPRSSADVHEKEIYMKKRHSLPGTNGRHGSPHIERSLSQVQRNEKGNETSSPQDRKWRR